MARDQKTMSLPSRYITAWVFGLCIVLMIVLQKRVMKDAFSATSESGMEDYLQSEFAGFRKQLDLLKQQHQGFDGQAEQFMTLRNEISGMRYQLDQQQSKQQRLEGQIQQLMNLRRSEQVSQNTTDEGPVVRVEQQIESNVVNPFPIDFVIPAFPKCGTSMLLRKLALTKGVYVPDKEIYNMRQNRVGELHKEFEGASNSNQKPLILGYKSPDDLKNLNAMNNLESYYPDIKMIIQLRHPVLQFESMYNHRLRTRANLLPVENYVGVCNELCMQRPGPNANANEATKGGRFAHVHCKGRDLPLCTGQSSFHYYLSRLGLTPMNTRDELDLLDLHIMNIHEFSGWQRRKAEMILGSLFSPTSTNGRLFLMEMGQIENKSGNGTDALFSDLEDFLGLERGNIPRSNNGREQHSYTNETQELVLDICRDEYKPIRDALLVDARKSSKWILKYLLHPSNGGVVVVSNIDDFKRMVQGWTIDPCRKKESR